MFRIASNAIRGRRSVRIADSASLLVALRRPRARPPTHNPGLPFLVVNAIFILAATVGLHLNYFVAWFLVYFVFDAVGGGCCSRVGMMTDVHPAGFSWLAGRRRWEIVVRSVGCLRCLIVAQLSERSPFPS